MFSPFNSDPAQFARVSGEFLRARRKLVGAEDEGEHVGIFLASQSAWAVAEAHIFEMVGFCNRAAGSQRLPPGLPGIAAPDVGDFLALLANRHSNAIAEKLLALAAELFACPAYPTEDC